MRRILLLTVVAVAACAASPVALARSTRSTRATVEVCHTGPASADRYVTFGGQMSALPGTQRMQMRFDLLVRRGRRWYRHVSAPGLGVWQSTADGVGLFRYHQQVAALAAGASYRAIVRFRWLDDHGKTLHQSRRLTTSCRQPDLRPDLVPGRIRVLPSPGDPSSATYQVSVGNRGVGAAGPFAVDLSVNGEDRGNQPVSGLAAGRWATVSWTGPACPSGSSVKVTVDAAGQVDESRESNDTRLVTCPTSGS